MHIKSAAVLLVTRTSVVATGNCRANGFDPQT